MTPNTYRCFFIQLIVGWQSGGLGGERVLMVGGSEGGGVMLYQLVAFE